jgi:hypothetical protein
MSTFKKKVELKDEKGVQLKQHSLRRTVLVFYHFSMLVFHQKKLPKITKVMNMKLWQMNQKRQLRQTKLALMTTGVIQIQTN